LIKLANDGLITHQELIEKRLEIGADPDNYLK